MRARKGWTKKLKEVQKRGLIVCAASQTIYGRLNPKVYSSGRELEKAYISLRKGIKYVQDDELEF